jgi:hypothetical protein
MVLDGSAPRKARMHGLWALIGTGSLEPDFHTRLLDHTDPTYRAWGVRAAGDSARVASAIRDEVVRLARDRAPDVQLQVAIAARKVEGLDSLPILIDVLAACGEDKLIPPIVWNNLHPLLPVQGERFVRLIESVDLRSTPALAKLLPLVVDRILGEPGSDLEPVRSIIERLATQDARLARECLSVVSDRVREMPETRGRELRTRLQPSCNASCQVTRAPICQRPAFAPVGIRSLTPVPSDKFFGGPAPRRPPRPWTPDRVQGPRARTLSTACLDRVGRVPSRVLPGGEVRRPGVAEAVLARYPAVAELQPLAVDLLLQRGRGLGGLDAVLARRFSSTRAPTISARS